MVFKIIAHVVLDAVNLAIGGHVLWKNPRDIVHRSFFVFVCAIVVWSTSMLLLCSLGYFPFAIFSFLGGETVVLGFIFLAEFFPDGGKVRRRFLWSLLPWVIFVIFTPIGFVIQGAQCDAGGYLKPHYGPLFPWYGVTMGVYIGWSILKLLRRYKASEGIRRVQLRYLLGGAGIFISFAFLSNVLLSLFHIHNFNLLGPLFSIIFIGSTAYAMVRHQFMDIQIVIKRGLLYAMAMAGVGFLYFTIDFVLDRITNDGGPSAVVSAILGAFGFLWLRNFFRMITDRFFFRGEYQYENAIHEMGLLLGSSIEVEAIISSLRAFLMKTVKPVSVVVIVKGKAGEYATRQFIPPTVQNKGIPSDRYEELAASLFSKIEKPVYEQEIEITGDGANVAEKIRALGVSAVVPFFAHGEAVAVMFLGKKLSDDIFRLKDMMLLSVLSHQGGVAIENALLYEEAKRYGEELEKRVVERTARIKGMQEAQSKFLTDISHELQTPIAVLRGNLEILGRKKSGERKTALAVMEATLARMSRLVESLLSVARLNFSKDKLHKSRVAVENLLEETYHDCLVLGEDMGILLSYVSEPVFAIGDKDKLKEVILNLVSNALKHTSSGGRITLTGRAAGSFVEISVLDTGSGIPEEELPHIFERFYRIGAQPASGTGLGLDIVRKIVEAHDGTISVESETGRGTKFVISLPAAPSDV